MPLAIIIVTIVFVVISIVVTVVSFIKFKNFGIGGLLKESQKLLDENQENINQIRESLKKAGFSEKDIEDGKVVCPYCGGIKDANAYKCPNCGAVKK